MGDLEGRGVVEVVVTSSTEPVLSKRMRAFSSSEPLYAINLYDP